VLHGVLAAGPSAARRAADVDVAGLGEHGGRHRRRLRLVEEALAHASAAGAAVAQLDEAKGLGTGQRGHEGDQPLSGWQRAAHRPPPSPAHAAPASRASSVERTACPVPSPSVPT
jgi:hypothetical protein